MPRKHKRDKKKEEKQKNEKLRIRKNALKEINSLSRRIKAPELDKQAKEFYDIIRKFFAKLFKIKYMYTYEELRGEIEKKKIDPRYKNRIEKFTKKLTYIEYSKITLTNERIKELINEFKYLVKKLTIIEKPEEKAVSKKLDKLLKKIVDKTKIFKKLEIKRVTEPKKAIKEINLLLKESKEAINNGQRVKAEQLYQNIDSLYRKLSYKDKNLVYKKIILIYRKKQPIYDLLNQAYSALINHKTHEAKQLYLRINQIYEELPLEEKEKMHDEILKVFRPKKREDIEILIKKAYYYLAKKEINMLKELYEEIETAYRDLSIKERSMYYSQLIRLYDDIKLIFS